ncbi:hypothetical protein P152DRAFT_451914 [Eremomyces bilateralis CBS 781.70]|uniref:Uncharacterized protein n=1 Tax=Eremomyces bilateralis CBS 781.70 TaxID=1392243 RepID=A0A6G1FU96_9PEZI|nr:uncharacterized protein P152DRAFT_451914 [Eremomyces bilateralis CBS 781.70]KAF1809465.1 hypothetical protein P152DRAFT_451914 [Eremomyces bilateralis CBS 781.70]
MSDEGLSQSSFDPTQRLSFKDICKADGLKYDKKKQSVNIHLVYEALQHVHSTSIDLVFHSQPSTVPSSGIRRSTVYTRVGIQQTFIIFGLPLLMREQSKESTEFMKIFGSDSWVSNPNHHAKTSQTISHWYLEIRK